MWVNYVVIFLLGLIIGWLIKYLQKDGAASVEMQSKIAAAESAVNELRTQIKEKNDQLIKYKLSLKPIKIWKSKKNY